MPAPATSRRVKILTASLIALTSVLGAVGAWRASVASGAASDADRKGFSDNVAQTQQRAAILIRSDAILIDFVRMHAYDDEAVALRKQAEGAPAGDAARLEAQADSDQKLAQLIRTTIDPDAIRPDGSLDLTRKFQIEFELAKSQQDLDPDPDFALSDRMRSRSERLVGLTALFIAAALFLTLAQVSRTRARRLYFGGGLVVLLVSTAFLLMVEVL
jgi:hypothetical protein